MEKIDLIYQHLQDNAMSVDDISEDNGTIEITIYLGDWKHSHKRLDYLMGLIDYELIKEVEEPNDDDEYDDAYTSVHYYKFKGLNK